MRGVFLAQLPSAREAGYRPPVVDKQQVVCGFPAKLGPKYLYSSHQWAFGLLAIVTPRCGVAGLGAG